MNLPMICGNCESTLTELIKIYKKNDYDHKKIKECTINAFDYDQKNKTCLQFFFESCHKHFVKDNQPERSKREDLDCENCKIPRIFNCCWYGNHTNDNNCDKYQFKMRCSEHCGNTVRDK